jgi:ubiquitin carboxyl-terminal hydrolase 9/13
VTGGAGVPGRTLARINTEPLPTTSANALAAAAAKAMSPVNSPNGKEEKKRGVVLPAAAMLQIPNAPIENKDSSEYKKKRALESGPVLDLDQGNHNAYGMEESLFTALKDIFESVMAHSSKTGVVKPIKFLEILRKENDMFNGQQHQDAHEFLNYVLNQVIENVEAHQKKLLNGSAPKRPTGSHTSLDTSSTTSASTVMAGWIHELFEGLLTSETKCLTCENVSRRDEQFMDLSIDLERNSSVTSCLRNFSASEMLCERNKFHCDTCGGLQEAEKRMKIKRLPKVLALHLKRFKYMEATNRFEKLHYRVLYPYHLRLFNTTDDSEDPDRLYELFAVVVHIGGGPYHGHYVAIVKTEDKGWLLFDDELVEPVDKAYVRNFFGERAGTGVASAYVLFYQETTLDAVQREMWAEEQAEAAAATAAAATAVDAATAAPVSPKTNGKLPNGVNGTAHLKPIDAMKDGESLAAVHPSVTSPYPTSPTTHDHRPPATRMSEHPVSTIKSKKEKEREKLEKLEKKPLKFNMPEKENGVEGSKDKEGKNSMARFGRSTSRSIRQSGWFGHQKDKEKEREKGKDKTSHSIPRSAGADIPRTPQIPTSPLPTQFPPIPPVPNHTETKDPSSVLSKSLPTPSGGVWKENTSPPRLDKELPPLKKEKERGREEKKREKEYKKDKKDHKSSDHDKKKHHHHRPSIFGLRKKAQTAGVE